ncbi:MAG: FecR domain-containing protein [Rhizobacter sp.]
MSATLAPIDPRILDEAADWLVRLHDGNVSEEERVACDRWRQRGPEHARAWARAELLVNKLGGLPPSLAMPVLDRRAGGSRRAAVAKLAGLIAAVPAGWLAWQVLDGPACMADHRTAAGERRDVTLADGTRLTLNTQTSVDVRFDDQQRLLRLVGGELMVQTAPDTAAVHRPLRVLTAQARFEALGTRFSLRLLDGITRLAVLDGAVRVEPSGGGASHVLQAGEQVEVGAVSSRPVPLDAATTAWTRGMLLADAMRLGDFAEALSRYRQGVVSCDPAVAHLRISGAFPIDDTDRALAMLSATYPVQAARRFGGRWVTLVPRAA